MPELMTAVARRRIPLLLLLSLLARVVWVPQAAPDLGAETWAPGLKSPLNALAVWSPGMAARLLVGRDGGILIVQREAPWRPQPSPN